MGKWFSRNFKTIIYVAFLVPIITVAIVSISHVTQWYGISNPLSWAVYLSIGIEIAALSALAAISAQMGSKVYFPFGIVTLIQFVGNIFFAFEYIKIDSVQFLSWVELTGPILEYTGIEQGDLQSHRRFLAIFAGGMLPLISLSFLHMLVKFNEENRKSISSKEPINENIVDSDDKPSNIIDEDKEEKEVINASDLIAEISRFRPTEDELKTLEELLSKFKPEEPKERPSKEEQREILTQMMKDDEDLGLYDETPEPPSWMDEIPEPTEEDYRDWDVTLTDGLDDNNVSWDETEYLLSSEKNKERLDSSIQQLETADEDHMLDEVLNDMVEEMTEEQINSLIDETVPEPFATPEELRKIEVILDELPTPSTDFDVDVQVNVPEPTKKIPNKYELIEDYLNYTRGYDDVKEETPQVDVVLDQSITQEELNIDVVVTTPIPQSNPNFVVKEPIQDNEDPEKKN